MYESTAKLYVVNSKDSAINLSDLQIGNYLAKDYKEVFNNWHVHERVLSELGLPYTYKQLNNMISITNPTDTRILAITVKSPDPEEAKTMAGAYARVACEFIAVKMDQEQPNIFEEPRVPNTPSSPSIPRNLILGFLVGVLIAGGILTVQFVMDDRVRTPEDIEELLHVPTLGIVTEQNTFHSGHRAEDEKRDKKNQKAKPRN
jgi:capsular polysaccharide biosynthesis protein